MASVSGPSYQPSDHLRRLVRGTPLFDSAQAAQGSDPLGIQPRTLRNDEVRKLEAQGCIADDWTRVLVQEGFDPSAVREVEFAGDVSLARFFGSVMLPGGVALPTGIRRARIEDCAVGNACVRDVTVVCRQILHDACAVVGTGAVVCGGDARFATSTTLCLGPETGGREVGVFAEIDLELATWLAFHPGPSPQRLAYQNALMSHTKAVTSPRGQILSGARVLHCRQVRDSWIGPGARLDGADLVCDVAVLSSIALPAVIRDGAVVEQAILQAGSFVHSHAVVRKSVLCTLAGASRHACLQDAFVGPCTEIQQGEVTSSLVGPLVGFHHQSMLIGVLWPHGRGNVAHGAMVGSNHTGRTADQECHAGEGQFFGLGCAVQFPADFRNAPWTLIAAGTRVPAQALRLPFCLVQQDLKTESAVPRVRPGWFWTRNAWAFERAESKLRARDGTPEKTLTRPLLHAELLDSVESALLALQALPPREVHLAHHLIGLAAGWMTESDRLEGVEAYREILVLAALRCGFQDLWASRILDHFGEPLSGPAHARRLANLEKVWARRVQRSRERDDLRGIEVHGPDYLELHPPAAQDPVVRGALARARDAARRAREVSRNARSNRSTKASAT